MRSKKVLWQAFVREVFAGEAFPVDFPKSGVKHYVYFFDCDTAWYKKRHWGAFVGEKLSTISLIFIKSKAGPHKDEKFIY